MSAELLRHAVNAQLALWDATKELEVALGFVGDIHDEASDYIVNRIQDYAVASDDVEWIGDDEFASFVKDIPE